MQSRNTLISILQLFYFCLEAIVIFFVPKCLHYKSVKGELVLITGGGSGLGRELAIRFAKLGANIVVWDINKLGLDETIKLINETNPGVKAYCYLCDITDRKTVYALSKQMSMQIGNVTILINNAGYVNGETLMELEDKDIIKTFMVNVISHFWITKAFLPDMINKNKGHLVTIASIAGYVGTVQLSDYCATKFACVGFEESLRLELQMQNLSGIKSTLVAPYFMNTSMFDGKHIKSPILSVLEPSHVADDLIAGILTDSELVIIPKIFYTLNILKPLIPTKAYYKLYEIFGGFNLMEHFHRQNHVKKNKLDNYNNEII